MKAVAAVVLALASLAGAAAAQERAGRTVRHLYELCRAEDSPAERAYCHGYLFGAADLLRALGYVGNQGGICDADYSTDRLRQLFVAWAEKNPRRWREDQLTGVVAAFQEVWPCAAD